MASLSIRAFLSFLVLHLQSVPGQDYTYVGCFYDDYRREILPDLIYCDRNRYPYASCQNVCGPELSNYCQSQTMTIELCRDICSDQNMRYFGLQAGTQCLCGGEFAPYDAIGAPSDSANNTCNSVCVGNANQFCGGEFQASVYQMTSARSDCFNPGYVLNGNQSQIGGLHNITDTIDYATVCPPPSIKNGSTTITCTSAGNWTDSPPTCTVRCPQPTAPPYANFSPGQNLADSYAVDDNVLFDCSLDATIKNRMLICGYFGNWATTTTCPAPATTQQPTSTFTIAGTPKTSVAQSTDIPHTGLSSATTATLSPSTSQVESTAAVTQNNMVKDTLVLNWTTTVVTTPPFVSTNPSTGAATTPPGNSPSVSTASSLKTTSGNQTTPSAILNSTARETTSEGTNTDATTKAATSVSSTPSPSADTATAYRTDSGSSAGSESPLTTDESQSPAEAVSGGHSSQAGSGGGDTTEAPTPTSGGRKSSNDMGLLPIIIAAAAGGLLIILVIIVVSVCCSRKKKMRRSKNIPFDPALGTSFGNPTFEDNEREESQRGFVRENDYGDLPRQTYDIGVSEYATLGEPDDRAPPDGKASAGDVPEGGIDPSRNGSVTSFKPSNHSKDAADS